MEDDSKPEKEEYEEPFDEEEEIVSNFLHFSLNEQQLEGSLVEFFQEYDQLSQNFNVPNLEMNARDYLEGMKKELEERTCSELEEICKGYNIAFSGVKAKKIERILNYIISGLNWKDVSSDFEFSPKKIILPQSDVKNIDPLSSPLDIFSKFFTPRIIQDLAEEISCIIQANPRRKNESPLIVTPELIYGFFSLILETSFNHKKDIKLYGSSKYFKDSGISQNKWLKLINSLWHLSNDFFDLLEFNLNDQFIKYFVPDRNVTIDETLRRFKGYWKSKVYSPDKPAKFGLKYYCLVDRNGYLLWFKLHRSSEIIEVEEGGKIYNLCKEGIDHLISFNPGISFHLYTDNYYGSLSLANYLLEKGWDLTIGLRANRMETSALITSLKAGIEGTDESFACKVNNEQTLAIGAWKDKK